MRNKYNIPSLNNFLVCFDKQNNYICLSEINNSKKQTRPQFNKNKLIIQETFFTN